MFKLVKKRDLANILGLLAILLIGFIINYGRFGDIIVDCGREAFLPTIVFDKNYIMYKDIFNLYPPFAYQFNSILYKIFGENLNTLYVAGLINTSLIISCLYYITNYFTNSAKISFAVSFFAIGFNIFGYINPSMEFFYPYSYSYIYALSTFLISLCCFLKFLKNTNDIKLLYFTYIFTGISISNKFEFALVPIIYFIAPYILKIKLTPKQIIACLISFLTIPIISFGYLFMQD